MPRLLTLFVLPVLAVFAVALSAQERPSRIALVGGHLATATRSQLALFDLSTGLPVARLEPAGYIATLEASPVEDVIAVGTCARAVELWNVKSRRRLHRFAIKRECVNSVSFSPDGALLAIADIGCCVGGKCPDGGSVQIWDVRSGMLKQELARDVDISRVVFSRDGRWLAGVDNKGKTTVFEWPSGRQLRTFGGGGAGGSVSAGLSSPDGKYLAWQEYRELHVWNVASGTRITLPASASEFLNDGRLAYVDGHHLRIVTLPNGPIEERQLEEPKKTAIGDIWLTEAPEWRRIHRNGRTIAGTYGERTVLWDIGAATLRDLSTSGLRR
jgi:hypothetical protein